MGPRGIIGYFFKSIPEAAYGLVVLLVVVGTGIYSCKENSPDKGYVAIEPITYHKNGQGYVGSESCKECHSDIYETHIKTAHYGTSAKADKKNIHGNFQKGKNHYRLNDSLGFELVSDRNGAYQQSFLLKEKKQIASDTLGVVIGSGTKGQTYLKWDGDALYQLQVSYYAPTDEWTNSPGMSQDRFADARPVNSSCLECHVTFAKSTALYGMGNTFKRDEILYGVDCERCHGPSERHVNLHRENPEERHPFAMKTYDDFTQQQRLDACALCHSGIRTPKKPAFAFLPGDTLSHFSIVDETVLKEPRTLDVHGNQYGLLKASACFEKTETMLCTTCHDPHKPQRGATAMFNEKCMGCHMANKNIAGCTEKKNRETGMGTDCISCHMPMLDSKSMRIAVGKDSTGTAVQVRTHLIGIYE